MLAAETSASRAIAFGGDIYIKDRKLAKAFFENI